MADGPNTAPGIRSARVSISTTCAKLLLGSHDSARAAFALVSRQPRTFEELGLPPLALSGVAGGDTRRFDLHPDDTGEML